MGQCCCMDEEYQCSRKLRFQHYYVWLFLQVALLQTPPLRVLEVHINGIRGVTIHITESNIHISYSENNHSTLVFYYFYMSPLPTLAHIIAKGSTFSITCPFYITKLQKIVLMCYRLAAFGSQCRSTRIFISLTTPIAMGTQLCFKRNWESHSSSRKL